MVLNIRSKLAKKLYDLFVVNPYAIAVQQDDGRYITKYIPYDYTLIEAMLRKNGALGCYQQGFKNGLIKWICLDFDCRDKENPQIDLLYSIIKEQLLIVLDELGINYLTEFSGRRGIHVWILFSSVFSKKIGFEIVNTLYSKVEFDQEMFGVDLFPATDISKNNKVGKQVKVPLSCHRNGGRSFIFEGEPDFECIYRKDFYEQQYDILSDYAVNNIDSVCEDLGIDVSKDLVYKAKYKMLKIGENFSCPASDVEDILSELLVFRNIFDRLHNGTPLHRDWFVMLGTIGAIDTKGEILKSLFATSPAYDDIITGKNILIWKDRYFPATLSYLYRIYNLECEDNVDLSETGTEYLIRRINQKYNACLKLVNEVEKVNEKTCLLDIRTTVAKEKYYLLINDENLVISVWNSLNNMTDYDYITLNRVVDGILRGEIRTHDNKEYYEFERFESEEKQRNLIVLGAYDRVITTHLAMILAYHNYKENNSFSYNVAFLSQRDIFYNWYTSWGNYIDKIKAFLEIPYRDDWGVFVIDVKGFYDSINFLAVYNLMRDSLNDEDKRIFEFLVRYNEQLMREINGNRIGVPQGPAYARIISEMFISNILSKLVDWDNDAGTVMYRYVDDIIVFYDSSMDGKSLYDRICDTLKSNGLDINRQKSRLYGSISKLTDRDRKDILRKDKFNYMLKQSDTTMLLSSDEMNEVYAECISDEFSIDDVAFMFSKRTNEFYTYVYFHKYKNNIISSEYGRGSIFMRFYKYVFSRRKFALELLNEDCLNNILLDSLNFKNCISSLYYVAQKQRVDRDIFTMICEKFLKILPLDELDDEERITINSLLKWEKENG